MATYTGDPRDGDFDDFDDICEEAQKIKTEDSKSNVPNLWDFYAAHALNSIIKSVDPALFEEEGTAELREYVTNAAAHYAHRMMELRSVKIENLQSEDWYDDDKGTMS